MNKKNLILCPYILTNKPPCPYILTNKPTNILITNKIIIMNINKPKILKFNITIQTSILAYYKSTYVTKYK